MKALTIWQPWASLIAIGAKNYEFRTWPAPGFARGHRIVIHAAARETKRADIAGLLNDPMRLRASTGASDQQMALAMEVLEKEWANPGTLMLGAGLCSAVLGQPRRATDCMTAFLPVEDIDPDTWAWPLTDIQPFEAPIPSKGAQGFWNWTQSA